MKRFLKKVRGDKKGFTLAELLVVVAIIAILVAVSIPIFTAQLSKARKATNQANLRAAKAAAVAEYLTKEKDGTEQQYKYDLDDGTVAEDSTKVGTGTDYPEVTIEGADSDKKYVDIFVVVDAAAEGDANETGSVKLYAKKGTK